MYLARFGYYGKNAIHKRAEYFCKARRPIKTGLSADQARSHPSKLLAPCHYSEVAMTDLDSRKHGISASQLAIHPDEIFEFNQFLAGLFEDMRPSGEIQRLLFGQILHASWNMRLARKAEAKLLLESGPADQGLKAISQFYLRCDRAFYRAVAELRNMQTELAYRLTLASDQRTGLPDIPPLVRTALVHKQVRAATPGRAGVPRIANSIRLNQLSG